MMSPAFNDWWSMDETVANSYYENETAAYWAWLGWKAGAKAEREELADMVRKCDPRATPRGIAAAIKTRSNT
jgi:hypothetical protein